ncbi:MAG: hypothetical protein R3A10_07970 [Caldilineaceae bacterium]
MSAYQFDTQKRVGVAGEDTLDAFFRQWRGLHIRPATDTEQRRGIDRMFTVAATGREAAVEYKTDYMAGRTGNAFVESGARRVPGSAQARPTGASRWCGTSRPKPRVAASKSSVRRWPTSLKTGRN